MPRTLTSFCLLAAVISLVGCDSVGSVHPVGVVSAEDLSEQLNGVWVFADDEAKPPFHLRYLGEGDLAVAAISWEGKESGFTLKTFTGRLLEDDDVLFLNLRPIDLEAKEEPTDEDRHYFFLRMFVQDDGTLQIAGPNVATFAAAVESGALKGSVERNGERTNVVIESDAATLNTFIDPSKAPEQFDMAKASVLKRIAQPDR